MIEAKKAIIAALRNSSGVQTALGNTSPDSVREAQGFVINGAVYPSIAVAVSTEKPHSVEQVASIGVNQVNDVYLDVHLFSKQKTSSQLGTIDYQVRKALQGANLTSGTLRCFLCEYDSLLTQDRDQDTGVWHQVSRYHLIASLI